MMLTGPEIVHEYYNKNITIEPFNLSQVNPNSYNLKLGNKLLVYTEDELDMKKDNPTKEIIIPEEGYVLQPGVLYLGKTEEWTLTRDYVPCLDGRSSVARLGIVVHICAGFGDIGFGGHWTLEITVSKPIRVYAGVEICQIYFHEAKGEKMLYEGKYQYTYDVMPSRLYKEFTNEE